MPAQPSQDIVVFWVQRNDSACSDCGQPLAKGEAVHMSDGQPLCLECADLDHLVFVPAGNAALTRRAKKYTRLWAVVVKWSKARKRYERQGMLVEEQAANQAEIECLSDDELKELSDLRGLRSPGSQSKQIRRFAKRLRELYPGCPAEAAAEIAGTVCRLYHGRIGELARAETFDDEAVRSAVRAHLRHAHTNYDQFRLAGTERTAARAAVADEVAAIEAQWSGGG